MATAKHRGYMSLLVVLGTVLLTGTSCNKAGVPSDAANSPQFASGAAPLTAEAARSALAEMIGSAPVGQEPVWYTLDAVKTAAPRETSEGHVLIGPWECDLANRTFTFANIHPPTFWFDVVGRFVISKEAKWQAVVTRVRWS